MGRRPQKLELTWFNKDQALILTEEGKYGYTWVDPKDPRYCETHTLIIDDVVRGTQAPKEDGTTYSERADLEPTENNLLILGESGDVLEALIRVPELADKYVGKVKCVYIDPPFNTEQAFPDYADNLEHSVWLTMMRDRLIHLRQLLSDNGSIWVHLDDGENHRMRVLLDEVFGAGNFVVEVAWRRRTSVANDSNTFTDQHDTILVYSKTENVTANRVERAMTKDDLRYKSVDGDSRLWGTFGNTSAPKNLGSNGLQVSACYGIQHPLTGEMIYPPRGGQWAFRRDRIKAALDEYANWVDRKPDINERCEATGLMPDQIREDVPDLVLEDFASCRESARKRIEQGVWPEFFVQEKTFGRKVYQASERTSPPASWWPDTLVGHNRESKSEIKALFPDQNAFSTPKPERLLERIIHIATDPGDTVLDVFAGSGTTAAVAHKMGRRWVTCELVKDTVERFTRPRLEKVVRGEDPGGITLTKGERVEATKDGLPEGMSAEDAQKLTSLLNKAISDRDDLKKNPAIKELKSLVKTTKSKDTVNWRGGGSFTVARLSSSCFDYDPELDLVTLTEAATGQTLVESVAANLGFYLTPEDRHFDGVLGRQHLAVVEGVLDDDKVDDLMVHLPKGHTLLIAATIVTEGVREYARGFKNGSRVVNIPLDIFTYTKAQEEN